MVLLVELALVDLYGLSFRLATAGQNFRELLHMLATGESADENLSNSPWVTDRIFVAG
jgi:hypothetical protein